MLVRLRTNAAGPDRDEVLDLARELGYRARPLDDERGVLLELSGSGGPDHRARFEDLWAVESILDAGEVRERALRAPGAPDTIVHVGPAAFGGGEVSLIAGPCAVEDEERLVEIARAVRDAGATALRGGAYKPRSSPYSFQGSRERGLQSLARARLETGLAIVTEVMDTRDVETVGEVADMFQVGARNMANYPLLTELGRQRKPVLLKRGFAATLRELLLAAEYVLAGGNERVVLCERGIRGFDPSTRNVLDVGGVAWLKHTTHLPVIVDPSHAAGRGDLVPALARSGLAAGADGVMCEVHPRPAEAHSDAEQAISPATFAALARDAAALLAIDGRRLVQPAKEPTP